MKRLDMKWGYIIIDGEYYEFDRVKGKPFYKKIPKEFVNNRIYISKKIAKRLKESLDSEKVLMENLMLLPNKDFDKLFKMLFKSKQNYKAKTREHRCVDMKIGNFVLPIVGG